MKVFYKMHVYKLLRSKEIDKKGRPAVFLSYFGEESLVWCGTTKLSTYSKEEPIIIHNNGKTEYLISKWREAPKQKGWILSQELQIKLINKFIEVTNQESSYQVIDDLNLKLEMTKINYEKIIKMSNEVLHTLQQENQFLRQQLNEKGIANDENLPEVKERI